MIVKNGMMKTALILFLCLLSGAALAGDKSFSMPKDMKALLPAQADIVLAVSSLDELDDLWREILPDSPDRDEASLSQFIENINPEFIEYVDRDKPFLAIANLKSIMGDSPFLITGMLALKDSDFEVSMVPGLEKFNPVRKGDYLAVSTDPDWAPAEETPAWARTVREGLLSTSINLTRMVEANRMTIEMGLSMMENPDLAKNAETAEASAKLLRVMIDSIEGLDFVFNEKGDNLYKDINLRLKPGSALEPGPQPSFKDALKMTRFLPGGESLLTVSAYDQSEQADLYRDYYLATMRAAMELMDPPTAERYEEWFTGYVDALTITFAPSVMTLNVEKDNSRFLHIIKSNNAEADYNTMVNLGDTMNRFAMGLELLPIAPDPYNGHEIAGWTIIRNDTDWDNILNREGNATLDDPLTSTGLLSILRLLPGNLYLSRVDEYLLFSGGKDSAMMEELIRRVEKGKGNVDPRLKKINKERGGHVQYASAGDLNTLLAVIIEMTEELSGREDIPWLSDKPLPFKQTYEFKENEYLFHLEMEKQVVQALIKGLMEWDW